MSTDINVLIMLYTVSTYGRGEMIKPETMYVYIHLSDSMPLIMVQH